MLKDGQIDMLGNMSFTEERARDILYATLPMGSETYYLFISPDNAEIRSESYASLTGKGVGVAKGSVQKDMLQQWAQANGVMAEIVEMTSTEEESLRLLGTELDALVTMDIHGNPETAVPVWKIGSSDYFFAVSRRRADLLSELNSAMSSIQDENESYSQQLVEKYLRSAERNHYLSTAEKKWVSDHGPIRVSYQDEYMAFCDEDENGELSGALKDYLAEAASCLTVPLQFEPVAYPTKAAMMEGLARGEVDCAFPANLTESDAEGMDAVITPSAMTTEVYAVVRQAEQQSFVIKLDLRAAVNQNASISDMFLADHFPHMEITYYPDTPACLRAVADGQADCLMISNYRYSSISRLCDKLRLTTIPVGVDVSYCFAIRGGQTELYSILTRITKLIHASNVSAALNYYSTEDARMSFGEFITEHIWAVLAGVAIIALVIVLLILRNARSERRADAGEKLISATEFDAITGLYNKSFFYEFSNRFYREHPDKPADAIVVNIDQFHSINELHGRDFGDRVLRALGAEIRAFLNENEGIGSRLNVDDFYIFCTPQGDYQALLDRFQNRVNQLSDHAGIRLRMGVMPWKADMEPVQMLDRAHTPATGCGAATSAMWCMTKRCWSAST